VHRTYEFTGICPYTDVCDSFQIIGRSERWMEQALTKRRMDTAHGVPTVDGVPSIHTLQWRLEHMRRVKERCYSRCHRCLRFRQFEARGEEATVHRRSPAWPQPMFDE